MDRAQLARWIAAYERAWRAPGTEGLDELFAEDATYSMHPFDEPVRGLGAIRRLWDEERPEGERFTMEWGIVAVEGDLGVVRLEVHYLEPDDQLFRDLWVVRLDEDGRCRAFEEWPFAPGRRVG
jgi:hypothetical protein